MESSETWRTKALKSFAISKSGMQGGEAKRNLPWSNFLCQSCQPLLEHFLKSNLCILYVVSKLRKPTIQFFKRCAIWSWNEGVIAIRNQSLQAEGRILYGCEITLLLRNDFAAILHSAVEFLLKFQNICDTLEAEHRKLKARFAALRNHPFAAKWFHSPFCASAKSHDLIFTCKMVLSASRYLRLTHWDIFLQIFVV